MAGLLFRHLVVGGYRCLSTCRQLPLVRKSLLELGELPQTRPCWPQAGSWRCYSSTTSGDGEESEGGKEEGGKSGREEEESESEKEENAEDVVSEDGEELGLEMLPLPRHHAIAPVNIPSVFPEVPVLPISRNPLFPRFVKMLEVKLGNEVHSDDRYKSNGTLLDIRQGTNRVDSTEGEALATLCWCIFEERRQVSAGYRH